MPTEVTSEQQAGENKAEGDTSTADLQAEVEKWKALARKHEERAATNADAARALEESKSEAEKLADRLAKLEEDAKRREADNLRLRIAAEHQISREDAEQLLTGTDEATLKAQAKRLAELQGEQRKQGAVVTGEGTSRPKTNGDTSDLGEFTRRLFATSTD